MSNEQRDELISCLLQFVKRATSESATSEEIAVLPDVAKSLFATWDAFKFQ